VNKHKEPKILKLETNIIFIILGVIALIIIVFSITNIIKEDTAFSKECEERYPNNSITYCDEVFCKCLPKSCLAYRDPIKYNECIKNESKSINTGVQ